MHRRFRSQRSCLRFALIEGMQGIQSGNELPHSMECGDASPLSVRSGAALAPLR